MKAIRWQVPFASISGTKYRVDIYDEGYTGTPVQLLAGETPFVTDEDDSDDFFAPVRTQTGTLQICTLLPNTTDQYITLDELLPANNIARAVRLINLDNSNAIEWQGFLSCEAYDQDYTSIPQNLDLPLIGVLEAMASVQLDTTTSTGLQPIYVCLLNILKEIEIQSGMTCFTNLHYSRTDYRIFRKYIDMTVLFEKNEYNNENSTTYIVSGMSTKDALSMICTYMGWIAREDGTELYLQRIGEGVGMYREAIAHFPGFAQDENIVEAGIAATFADKWRGTDHMLTVSQGAKSVEVVASLKKYKLNINLPKCPVGSFIEQYTQLWKYNGKGDWLYLLANFNNNAYNHISVACYSALCRYSYFHFESYSTTNLRQVLWHMAAGINSSAKSTINSSATSLIRWYAGAFLCRYDWEKTGTATSHNTSDALYCVFFAHSLNYFSTSQYTDTDFDPSQVGAIFSINSVLNFRCANGYLKLMAQADTVFMWPSSSYTGADLVHASDKNYEWYIALELQFGNYWWNGSSWQPSWCTFKALMTQGGFKKNWEETMTIPETDGLLIPIPASTQGFVTLKIWPMASPTNFSESNSGVLEMIFTQLSLGYIATNISTLTDRSENHYFQLLSTNFRDKIDIDTELASTLNNQLSPSLVMESSTKPMSMLDYSISAEDTSIVEPRRPEVDLLNRLAEYYKAARHRLSLIVAHPTAAPLPLLRLNGISPDNRKYLPLAEERDWQQETCTLTCFETPTETQESQS